jgi:inward rectifier potassium channel
MPPYTPPPGLVLKNARPAPFLDLYHRFLALSFPAALGVILAGLFGIDLFFSFAYLAAGGIANAGPGSFLDAFSFSTQTLATIGYGAMYPESGAAKLLSDAEAFAGLLTTALATGLLFAKFSQTRPALAFTKQCVVCVHDGIPTLMFRAGNDRGNLIVDAHARVVMVRTEKTKEGRPFYRMYDLQLVRDRSISFTRTWNLMHPITPSSPLYGYGPEEFARDEVEIGVSLVGTDDTSLQPVHGRTLYTDKDVRFGWRLADILRPLPSGDVEVDLARFDLVEPDDVPLPPLGARDTAAQ